MAPAVPRHFVGRQAQLARLHTAVEAARSGRTGLVLVWGEAGIGKTSLVAEALHRTRGVTAGWGTCWDDPGAPGYWPWTQALGALAAAIGPVASEVPDADRSLLAVVIPTLGPGTTDREEDAARARLRLFDALGRWLVAAGRRRPVAAVLDDLHWADLSSLELLEFVVRSQPAGRILLVAAYRHDEVSPAARPLLARLASRADHIHLGGLDANEVGELVTSVAGGETAGRWAAEVYRRGEGHPFFTRQLASELHEGGGGSVPRAALELVRRRLDRLSVPASAVLDAAALLGNQPAPDVVAAALDLSRNEVDGVIAEAVAAGVLDGAGERPRFAHDLFREAVVEGLPAGRARVLHDRLARALEGRHARSGDVPPQEICRHFTAAVPLVPPTVALRSALAAAAADQAAFALTEAAAHLTRLRDALTDAAMPLDDATWVDLLVAEADALGRAGQTEPARLLLARARTRATQADDAVRLAAVAFGVQRLGARFAMPRREVVEVLEVARRASAGTDTVLEARLTAAMARELHHSVPEDRPRAAQLSAEALELARRSGDPDALAAAALARHDVLWTPGTGAERVELAREITVLADQSGDAERHAEALLLVANALLESASPAFRPALQQYLDAVDSMGQPRHRYYALTRRAALALLEARLDEAEDTIYRAAELGEQIGEPDAGNVRMSQLLELTRARGDAGEQRAFARNAVEWWTGAPVHAHGVAAGFRARAGDMEHARHEVETVIELGGWNVDRSYLWSVYVSNLADAAAALDDAELGRRLLADLRPLGDSCGVNGAVVAFAGCHAHAAAVAARAAGDTDSALTLLDRAGRVYRRLGASGWASAVDATRAELLGVASAVAEPAGRRAESTFLRDAVLRRGDRTWSIAFDGATTTVPDVKGWRDLAVLLQRPGVDLHVLELSAAGVVDDSSEEMADAAAIAQYRQRLVDIEEARASAEADRDVGRLDILGAEREVLLGELRRVTGVGGRPRRDPTSSAERARKAVSARIHEAIRRLEPAMPELAHRLRRNVVTGVWCRYRGDDDIQWRVERGP